jgi:NADH dehydrogenase
MKKKRLVVIGGGFAGLNLAKQVDSNYFDTWVIDKVNHHQFQPLFYQVASARIEPSTISFPFRKIFQNHKGVHFVLAKVSSIDVSSQSVRTDNGDYTYDYLVIANGCSSNFFGNAKIEQHALGMKSTYEAIQIRNNILESFEKSEFSEAHMNIVIVGAGPTGVELAGAFAEMKQNILPKDYPNKDFSCLRIILVEGSAHTLNSMTEPSKIASEAYLRKLGVELQFQTFVKDYDGDQVTLSTGQMIPCKNLIWAAGVSGNTIDGLPQDLLVRGNRYKVNRLNQLIGFNNLYAIGDIAYMETPLYPNGHPQLANVAINQGKLLAKNLKSIVNQSQPKPYEYNDLGSMATVGKHKAVVELPFIKFQGYLAWFVWMFLHLMLILSVRNKLLIFFNWAWNYLANDSSLRLILGKSKKE